ncbi:uncharacterized protein LOC753771 isoform X1 [Strongylocentrotus purpuratus]|uniref:Uncharacterized protein n=1 Tax=Strongylocentrotus purpuratus TaxID=7668 RepID=A0A7M7HCV9_STRPU|nr:uncharacterized protein LOC753771 isoform X1 [Strongylocentrotus purpuratus]
MKSCTLIITACLLPAILAASVEKAKENEALLHRIVEKNVPSSYKKAYNILMKANELQARSHNTNEDEENFPGDGHDHDGVDDMVTSTPATDEENFPGDGHDHDGVDDVVTSTPATDEEHFPGDGHDHNGHDHDGVDDVVTSTPANKDVLPPKDPQIKMQVSEILAKTIGDVNDRLFSLAENIKMLTNKQHLLNARLSAVEKSVGKALISGVSSIHGQNQPLTDQAKPQDLNQEDNQTTAQPTQPTQQDEGDDSGITHQPLNVTTDNIEDGVHTEGTTTQVGQETAMPPHTSANVKGDQKQPTTMAPHTNGDSQPPSADGEVVIKAKREFLGDHPRYSFRDDNPFVGDRRGDVLGRLRDGLPHRQVASQVPVLPRHRRRLDQKWFQKKDGIEN